MHFQREAAYMQYLTKHCVAKSLEVDIQFTVYKFKICILLTTLCVSMLQIKMALNIKSWFREI